MTTVTDKDQDAVTFSIGKISAMLGVIALMLTLCGTLLSTGALINRLDNLTVAVSGLTTKLGDITPQVTTNTADIVNLDKRLSRLEK